MSFVLPSEHTDSHRELTFQRMVAKALGVGCKTSFCQSVRTNIYTLPAEFQQAAAALNQPSAEFMSSLPLQGGRGYLTPVDASQIQ